MTCNFRVAKADDLHCIPVCLHVLSGAEEVQNRAVEELQQFRGRLRALNLNVEQLTNKEVLAAVERSPASLHLRLA